MRTSDLFTNNRSAKKINESIQKVFGRKLNLENFDLPQLEDARNKLRTQLHTERSKSGFNETIENEALTQAQWMLDAINSEIAQREEFVSEETPTSGDYLIDSLFTDWVRSEYAPMDDDSGDYNRVMQLAYQYLTDRNFDKTRRVNAAEKMTDMFHGETEGVQEGVMSEIALELAQVADDEDYDKLYDLFGDNGPVGKYLQDMINDITGETGLHPKDDFERIESIVMDRIQQEFGGQNDDEGVQEGHFKNLDIILQDYSEDVEEFKRTGELSSQLYDALFSFYMDSGEMPYGVAKAREGDPYNWVADQLTQALGNQESQQFGESMRKVTEGEIQQASAIVTAKTMVDRVGRWIEELSGMENDTLLQLGDSIRDEMGQAQAKQFISAVAPAIQSALENLKTTRETLASGVRTLTGEEQAAGMLGAGPEVPGVDAAAPDAMNAEPEMGDEMDMEPADEFGASDAAVGGAEAAGREKRESIDYGNRLLKVLAG